MKEQRTPWVKVAVDNAEEVVAMALLVVTLVAIATQVTSRSVFNNPLVWPETLAQFLFLWASVLGTVGAIKRFELIRVDSLLLRAPPLMRETLEWIGWILICGLLVVLGSKGWQLAERTSTLATPLPITWAWGYAAAPAFAVLAVLRLCQKRILDYEYVFLESLLPDPPGPLPVTDKAEGGGP